MTNRYSTSFTTVSYTFKDRQSYDFGCVETSNFLERYRQLEEVEKNYIFLNKVESKQFLLKKEYLIRFLLESKTLLNLLFPESTHYLEFDADSEKDDWTSLTLIIENSLERSSARKQYKDLIKTWLFNSDNKIKTSITIKESPVCPLNGETI